MLELCEMYLRHYYKKISNVAIILLDHLHIFLCCTSFRDIFSQNQSTCILCNYFEIFSFLYLRLGIPTDCGDFKALGSGATCSFNLAQDKKSNRKHKKTIFFNIYLKTEISKKFT